MSHFEAAMFGVGLATTLVCAVTALWFFVAELIHNVSDLLAHIRLERDAAAEPDFFDREAMHQPY